MKKAISLKRVTAVAVALATAGLLSAGATASTAAADEQAACWPEGTRLKKTTEGRVYLIGPRNRLYWVVDQDSYNGLWGSWDGILTVPDAAFDACYHNGSNRLQYASLIKAPCCPAVYIWDSSYGVLRHIKDWSTFTNKYHFDPAKIHTGVVVNVDHDRPWT
jgi:hypothetical protein